ncbi:MAG: HD-like signal output (HDOD) protein [Candidatus Azotimanducaceae bacterium]|jgi:HD-like signal output (HDOD) protein
MSVLEINKCATGTKSTVLLTEDDIPNCSVADRTILELITDEDVDLDQLSDVIQENPSLVVLIISLANSAYFSSPTSINSIKDAIIKVLGIRMVKSIVLSVILGRSLDTSNCKSFSIADYWTDSLTSARFCQILADKTDLKNFISSEEIYLSALLAGFGELVLIQHYPFEMNEIILSSEGQLERYVSSQASQIGMTQSEAGVIMAKRWLLPDIVSTVMQYSFNQNYRGEQWQVCRIVGAVLGVVNKVRNEETDIHFDSNFASVLGNYNIDNEFQQLPDLRESLSRIAKHLSNGNSS